MTSPSIFLARINYGPPRPLRNNQRSRAGGAAARLAIRRATGRRAIVERRPGGRPVARWADGHGGEAPALSISYCDGYVGVAIAERGRLGLDLELRRSVSERVALRVMSPADAARFQRLERCGRREAATRHWTCAEALAKASGRGLPQMLVRPFTVDLAESGTWGRFDFAVCDIEKRFVCAIAHDADAGSNARVSAPTLLDLSKTADERAPQG